MCAQIVYIFMTNLGIEPVFDLFKHIMFIGATHLIKI
nr:hypothetical protein KBIHDJOI_00074 [Spodoptera littoralis nucleopolyhedrovirus]WOC30911.1 hypothetical protein GACBDANE_00082 [Spodoptera litura nucleopolyhedrovirus]